VVCQPKPRERGNSKPTLKLNHPHCVSLASKSAQNDCSEYTELASPPSVGCTDRRAKRQIGYPFFIGRSYERKRTVKSGRWSFCQNGIKHWWIQHPQKAGGGREIEQKENNTRKGNVVVQYSTQRTDFQPDRQIKTFSTRQQSRLMPG
jgi:hypothetical protein